MLTFKKLTEVPLEEAVQIWNAGFEGYFTDMTMNAEALLKRIVNDDMSAELSFVGYLEGEPVGIVLNGVRVNGGKKVAWNGGTGVSAKHRGKGIGKQLMQEALKIYREAGAKLATLEAMSQNEAAIKMYEGIGYHIADQLVFFQKAGSLPADPFRSAKRYQLKYGIAAEAQSLPMLMNHVPWQTQWQSLRRDGELLVVSNETDDLAYFLYKRIYQPDGTLVNTILFHADMKEDHPDSKDAVRYGLGQLFTPEEQCARMTFNFPESRTAVIKVLEEAGFDNKLTQVYMEKGL